MIANDRKDDIFVGIDLGTTYSSVARIDPSGNVEVIPNRDGDLKTESIVSLAGEHPVVGRAARPDLALAPQYVGRLFKRYMGQSIPIVTDPRGREWTPPDLSALVLEELKVSADTYLGRAVKKAVVTVPAYFDAPGREATKAAAQMAGFERVVLAEEPVAAAVHYNLEKGSDGLSVVVDFGGGTLDVAVVEKTDTQIQSKLVKGDCELGGSNYDESILQMMKDRLSQEGIKLDPDKDLASWYQNLDRAREAREMLSKRDAVVLVAEADGRRVPIRFAVADLRSLASPLDERFRKCCQAVVDQLGPDSSRLTKVVLVGGSTRMPHIRGLVQEIFKLEPSVDTDPDLAIAKGAAIIAATKFSQDDQPMRIGKYFYLPSQIRTQAVSVHAICVAARKGDPGDLNEYNVVIIPAGKPLPFEAREHFTPVDPRGDHVHVKVLHGEHGEFSSGSTLLKEFDVPVQPGEDNDGCIEVRMKYTDEGILEVEAWDIRLGQRKTVQFTYEAGLSQAEIEARKEMIHAT